MWTSNNQIVNQKGRLKRYITARSISLARFVQGLRDTVLSLARFEEPRGKFAPLREEWALKNRCISPGSIQFTGHGSDALSLSHTLLLELGAQ
ncbi:hypothetical protein Bca101_052876 [Brassica carinata]